MTLLLAFAFVAPEAMTRGKTPLWLYLVAYMASLYFLVPWESFNRTIGSIDDLSVDAAFLIALPSLFKSGAQYGTDVVFTYGPWGMLVGNVVPGDLYLIVVALRGFFAIVVAHLAVDTICRTERQFVTKIALILSLCGLVLLWLAGIDQGFWMFPSLFLGLRYVTTRHATTPFADISLLLAAALAASLAGLVKFNFFVFGLSVQLIIAMLDLSMRRTPLLLAVWIFGTCVAWLAAGQELAHLPLWIKSCLDLSAGYSDAMSKGFTKPYDWTTVSMLFAALCSFLAFAWTATKQQVWRVRAPVFLVSAICAFLAWQHAIGGNQIEQGVAELFAALWFLLAGGDKHSFWRSTYRRATLLPALSIACASLAIYKATELDMLSMMVKPLGEKLGWIDQANRARFFARRGDSWDRLMTSVRSTFLLSPNLRGSADIYPQHTAAIIATPNLRYTPRPAYLSLNAHTAALAQKNAESLRTNGPDLVLFQVLHPSRSVNNRFPATADGPSWPELLTRYEPVSTTEDFLVLKKRVPLPYSLVPLATEKVYLDQEIHVNPTRLMWARIKVKPSFLGRIVKFLYKAPHVFLVQTFEDGGKAEYQVVPALGEAGFLISPLVSDTLSFARLFLAAPQDTVSPRTTLASVQITTEAHMNWFWSSTTEIQFSELKIDYGESPKPLPAELANAMAMQALQSNVKSCIFPPSKQQASGVAGPIYLFHAPCSTYIDIPEEARGVTLAYGLRVEKTNGKAVTDGARVSVQVTGNQQQILASESRFLDPTNQALDRGEQYLRLDWTAGAAKRLKIDFDPGLSGDPTYDHTYVSRVEFIRR